MPDTSAQELYKTRLTFTKVASFTIDTVLSVSIAHGLQRILTLVNVFAAAIGHIQYEAIFTGTRKAARSINTKLVTVVNA